MNFKLCMLYCIIKIYLGTYINDILEYEFERKFDLKHRTMYRNQ